MAVIKKYAIKFRLHEGWLELKYQDSLLTDATLWNHTDFSPDQYRFIWDSLMNRVKNESEMTYYIANSEGKMRYQILQQDLSFDAFWLLFANKVGKKERTQQLWKLLPDEEKSLALAGIKKYKNWLLQNPSVQMLYPETYISQKRWQNEY